jgi:CRP-like cAMP-binding protein
MATARDDVVPALERSALFGGFDRQQLRQIAERFDEEHYLPDHRIVTEGMHGMEFFFILEGTAAVVDDSGVTVATLQAGDFFGEVAALDDGPRTASVRTITALRCLGLPNGSFKQFLLDYPLFAVNLLHQVVRRFRAVVTSGKNGH